ncbi:putative Transcriptional regulator LacI family [Vibrio nigripulchritudo SO65]|uniref:LacI family DNA-binding transcriptional regulator n=1 Tax=Vibrio nigripulchritudo TaxID=28173 RepID=UPI0003B1DE1F|nr:LacI family DNA-binding transcriptional regulator [Vibrio nigripulchritudo]CCN34334.1 putative Transcriptional regulator LacI family [Vibrio nigripulchritudo AM115]CCN43939.1 putative Transcriptional regulator LacI family [Vibrio nigripulchritudo FTn2]CCN62795.1 putative Transcriptional regulator LacI family [Vibrio nigripulchritudo POn4]CCN79571.1 putative Transcriptional regulator LacI family [Vibrio nigripulchritudo SO65]
MTAKKLTLKDVSLALGVSTATVSNAFNRPNQLSEKLRLHILAECEKMGFYGPNAAARSLKIGKSGIIGVSLAEHLQYNFSDPIATQFLTGVSEVFDEENINILLLPSRVGFAESRSFDAYADGFIVYGPPKDDEMLARLIRQHKPMVSVDVDIDGVCHINTDDEGAASLIATHTLSQPFQQVCILGLRLTASREVEKIKTSDLLAPNLSVSNRRLLGMQNVLKAKKGHFLSDEFIWNVPDNNFEQGYAAAQKAIETTRPDVILCMSDVIALGAMQACQDAGLNVPADVRISGFDDIPQAKTAGLTTIHQAQREKGRLAAHMILGKEPLKSCVIDSELCVRTSA